MTKVSATVSKSATPREHVQTWQQHIIRKILVIVTIVGALAVALPVYVAITDRIFWRLPILLIAYVAAVVVTIWRKAPYVAQAGTLVFLVYCMGVYNLIIGAQTGDGFPFMLTVSFLATLLFDRKTGWIALGIVVLTLAVFGGGFVSGLFAAPNETAASLVAWISRGIVFVMLNLLLILPHSSLFDHLVAILTENHDLTRELEKAYHQVEQQVEERTAELTHETAERERLQQEVIAAQQQAIQELSTPVIPVMDRILVMPLVGSIDTLRARDIMRALLEGIREHRAEVVILDVTGVPIMDSGVVNHLNKAVRAAQLKGAQAIVTGLSDAVAEAIVDLGIDWSSVTTLSDLQSGLVDALNSMGLKLTA